MCVCVCVCGERGKGERERGMGYRVHICSVRLDTYDIFFQRAILESVSNITL